jgi:hypothetical protein
LVSFFDLGGVGINVSLGWVPLGPEEVYVPYYRHSPRYVRALNLTNVRNETTIINVVNKKTVINVNNYRNYRGATSASRDVMEQGRAVGPTWKKNDKAKFDQQWADAKPEQEVPFGRQGNAEGKSAKGPKVEPQSQQQKRQSDGKPTAQPNLTEADQMAPNPAKAPQPDKNWNNKARQKTQDAAAPKADTADPIPLPPKSAAQKSKAPNKPEAASAAAEPKSNKKNQQPTAVSPTASAKPTAQPQRQQEPSVKKSQWKAQAPKGQAQQPQQQETRNSSKQGMQRPNASQHSEKASRGNQPPAQQQSQQQKPQKKSGQNCGQQPGACQ